MSELRTTNSSAHGFLDADNRKQVKTALRSVGRVASSLEAVSATVESVVSEKNRHNVERILENAEGATADMRRLARGLNDTLTVLDRTMATVDDTVKTSAEPMTAAVAELRATLSVIGRHVGAFSHHLEGTSRNLHEFTRQIRENPGLLLSASPQPERKRSSQ